jgi:hypothetical protein
METTAQAPVQQENNFLVELYDKYQNAYKYTGN